MAECLITGGLGFLGSHLTDKLIEKGHACSVVDDLSGGSWENQNVGVMYRNFDLRNYHKTFAAIETYKPEIIFHCAANAAENKAQFSPIDISTRNFNTFLNLIVPAINNGLKRFVFTSSIAVYGAGQAPFKETDKPEPEDLYGVSKLAVEQSLKILSEVHEFEYVIVRPHNVYGPRQNMRDPYRNVVTIWMNAILRGEPYYIYGDGEQRRCFTYIDDATEAIYNAGFNNVSGMTFNVGADTDYSLNQLSDAVRAATGAGKPQYLPDRPQEVKIATADHTLAKKHLGYKDKTSLKKGIAKTWAWCKKMGPQEPRYTGFEIDNPKIPENWRK